MMIQQADILNVIINYIQFMYMEYNNYLSRKKINY